MANLPESSTWEAGIYQLETSDPVVGGASGVSNVQAKGLGNRTKYLYDHVGAIEAGVANGNLYPDGSIRRVKLANGALTAFTRACILHGPVDGTSGRPSHTSGTAGTTTVNINGAPTPITLAFADGFDDQGAVDYIGRITADTTVSIAGVSGSGTDVYLFAVRNISTGAITYLATSDALIYAPKAPSGSSYKYWFDTVEQRWNEYSSLGGGSWVPRQYVMLARITRSATNILKVLAVDYRENLSGDSSVPVGSVQAMHRDHANPPIGWLHCNGASVSKTAYARLYEQIGGTYGETTDNFTLPDLRGEFLRGLDASRGIDSGRALGSSQAAEVGDHKHELPLAIENNGNIHLIDSLPYGTGGTFTSTDQNSGGGTSSTVASYALSNNPYEATDVGSGDNRPRNVAFPFFIKY